MINYESLFSSDAILLEILKLEAFRGHLSRLFSKNLLAAAFPAPPEGALPPPPMGPPPLMALMLGNAAASYMGLLFKSPQKFLFLLLLRFSC
jgi:hypothetical protein